MPELSGPLTHITLAVGLWVIPLAPLLAAAYVLYALLAPRMAKGARGKVAVDAGAIANASVVAAALAFGWAAFETLKLSQLEEGERFLLEHVFRQARFGQLDVALDFAFDPLTAVVLLSTSGVGLLLLVVARARGASAQFFGWASLLLGATSGALLADGLVTSLIAWELAAVAAFGLTKNARAFVLARAADGVLLVGAAMLFWGLGGVWTDAEYTPDLAPRFAAVRAGTGGDADDAKETRAEEAEEHRRELAQTAGKGLLTMSAYPGALVFMDDSRTPLVNGDAPLRSPFARFPIPGGLHSFRVHPGNGLDDYLVSHVALGKDKELTLGLFGATVTYASLRDQLAVKPHGDTSFRATLLGRKAFGGVGLVTAASLLLFAAFAARSAQAPFHGWLLEAASHPPLAGALLATTASLVGVYFVARLGFFISLSGVASAVIAIAGGLTAIAGAVMAARALDLRRVLLCLGVSELGLATLGAGAGAHAASAFDLAAYATGAGALWACLVGLDAHAGTDLRALGGLKKTLPSMSRIWFVTTGMMWALSVPKIALLSNVFATQGTARVPGWLLFALGALAVGLGGYAAWRAYFLAFEGKSESTKSTAKDLRGAANTIAWLLGSITAVGGVALGVGGRLFGKSGSSIMGEWLEALAGASAAPFAPASAGLAIGLLVVLLGVGLAAFGAARKRFGAERPAGWAARATADPGPAAKEPAAPAAAKIAAGVERWVLDGMYAAIGGGARALAFLASLVDDKLLGAGVDAVGDRGARLDVRARAGFAAACVAAVVLVLYLALSHKP